MLLLVRSKHPLADVLARKGLRHDWFAAQLGVSKWMLSHILAGRRAAPARFYREAALLLQVDEHDLRPPWDTAPWLERDAPRLGVAPRSHPRNAAQRPAPALLAGPTQ